mgnify:CR=1 FL=1
MKRDPEPAELILGTAQRIPSYGVASPAEPSERPSAEALLRGAETLGVTSLDTAPGYGDAEAEIGAYFEADPSRRFQVCTKLPALPDGLGPRAPAAAVRHAALASCARLRAPRIHAYLLHGAADLGRYGQPLVDALVALQEEGVVETLGVSVYTPEEALAVLRYPALRRVQLPFHLFDHRTVSSGAVSALREAGVHVDVRSVLLQGLLLLDPDAAEAKVPGALPWVERLRALAARHGVDRVTLALGCARQRSGGQGVVVGVDSIAQLEATHAAFDVAVPAAALDEVDALFADVPASVRDPRRWPASDAPTARDVAGATT